MTRVRCRKWKEPESERGIVVDDGDEDFAPDNFVNQFVDMPHVGAVVFVETLVVAGKFVVDEPHWVLWECECLVVEPLILRTQRTTCEKAEAEMEAAETDDAAHCTKCSAPLTISDGDGATMCRDCNPDLAERG